MMLNRKLLEKQRVQKKNDRTTLLPMRYTVHIGHFFYTVNAAVSFGNPSHFSIFHWTDKQIA